MKEVKTKLENTAEQLGKAVRIGMLVFDKGSAVRPEQRSVSFADRHANLGATLQRSEPVSNDLAFVIKWQKFRERW